MFNTYDKNKSLKKVLNGNFPEKDVKKMSRRCLESFVLKLVECSSDAGTKNAKSFTGLYKSLCLKQINKPEWWPSEKIIEQSLTSDGKYFMELLRFLVYKCCEFFKKPCESLNEKIFVNDNDENYRGVKRKCSDTDGNDVPKKRRTLMPKNISSPESKSLTILNDTIFKTPVIKLRDIFYKPKPQPLKQYQFLNIFGLQSTFNHNVEERQVPVVNTTSIKFNSCSIIPFSSDLGRELLKRDNHTFPESLKSRKLERLEWYVNQPLPRYIDIDYEITYQERKELTFHNFKFPKRTSWQHPGDVEYQKKILFCRPLKVILVRNNLEAIKEEIYKKSQCKLQVVLSRIPMGCVKCHIKKTRNVKISEISKEMGQKEKIKWL